MKTFTKRLERFGKLWANSVEQIQNDGGLGFTAAILIVTPVAFIGIVFLGL